MECPPTSAAPASFRAVGATRDNLLRNLDPFDAIVPGGPLRYVVSAVAEEDASDLPSTVAEPPRHPRAAAIAAR